MENKAKHGGAREGAGRKRIAQKTVSKSVKLTPEQWARAKEIGDGNAAEGIRRAIESTAPTPTESMPQGRRVLP
jgi:hypothetical protein